MQRIEHRLAVLLPNALAQIGVELFDLALNVVDLAELLQREPGELTFVCRMQVKEFAPGVRQAASFGNALSEPRFVPTAMWCTT